MVDHLNGQQKLDLAMEGVSMVEYGHGKSLQEAIVDEFGVELDDNTVRALEVMDMRLKVAEPGESVTNLKKKDDINNNYDDTMRVHQILNRAYRNDGDVYMAVTPNQKKAEIVWDMGRDDYSRDGSDNVVVEIPGTSWYERFEDAFGWKQLQDISLRSMSEYKDDISERVYNDLLDRMGLEDFDGDEDAMERAKGRAEPTPPEQERLNVSLGTKAREQHKFAAKKIKEGFEQNGEVEFTSTYHRARRRNKTEEHTVDTLILSPSSAEENMSDYYWLAGEQYNDRSVALANCNVGTYEYLQNLPGVYHIDKYVEMSWRTPIETHNGTATIVDDHDRLVLHTVTEEAKPAMRQVMDNVPETLEMFFETDTTDHFSHRSWNGPDYDEMLYAPVTPDELFELLPAIDEAEVMMLKGQCSPNMIRGQRSQYIKQDIWLYAHSRLSDWSHDSIEVQSVLSKKFPYLTEGGKELVDTLGKVHDNGERPASAV